jgi:hypothetical protein
MTSRPEHSGPITESVVHEKEAVGALMAGAALALAAGAVALLARNSRQTASAEPQVEAVPVREAA